MASHESHNLKHRRAVAAMLRRQSGFSPTFVPPGAVEPTDRPGRPGRPGRGDGDTTIVTDDLPTDTATSTSTSTTSSSTTTSSATTTSTTPTQNFTTLRPTTTLPPTTVLRTTSTTPRISTITSTTSEALASPTTSSEPTDSGMNTGAVVGGIGAGIAAIAVIGFGAAWAIRRARKKKDANFDPSDFRKSAMIIEEPTHRDTVDRGFNPPPSMAEMQQNYRGSDAYEYPSTYSSPVGYGPPGGYPHGGPGSFGPGQVMPQYGAMSPVSAGAPYSAHPYGQGPYSPAGYSQSPFSPVDQPSPMAERHDYYGGQYSGYAPAGAGAPAGVPPPVLTRQGSNGSQNGPPGGIPQDDYVDLNRSSVSPFQAAQYAEISRRLNPDGQPMPHGQGDVPPPLPAKPNPFSDPSAPPSPVSAVQHADDNRRPSGDSLGHGGLEDFPVPPSPVHTVSSRYRVDSTPPTLPEINVQARVSYNPQNFDAPRDSMGGNPPMSPMGYPSGLGAPANNYPAKPSPLASSFGVATPNAERTQFDNGPAPPPAAAVAAQDAARKQPSRQSMYDDGDAYGGF